MLIVPGSEWNPFKLSELLAVFSLLSLSDLHHQASKVCDNAHFIHCLIQEQAKLITKLLGNSNMPSKVGNFFLKPSLPPSLSLPQSVYLSLSLTASHSHFLHQLLSLSSPSPPPSPYPLLSLALSLSICPPFHSLSLSPLSSSSSPSTSLSLSLSLWVSIPWTVLLCVSWFVVDAWTTYHCTTFY